jgi:predicted nucleic acid-binding protein
VSSLVIFDTSIFIDHLRTNRHLIALTARAHGARLIASNRSDFELIRAYREFTLEIW